MTPKNIFKIRSKITGLYSSGGYSPKWSNHGKVWKSFGLARVSLKSYLDNNNSRNRTANESDLEIVKFELVEVSSVSATDVMKEIVKDKFSKKEKAESRKKELQRHADEAEFNRLKIKLGL